MTRPLTESHDKIRFVRAAYNSGILKRRGAKVELARILGVSKQYLGYLLRVVRDESEDSTRGNSDGR